NAEKETRKLELDLSALGSGDAVIISDGPDGKVRKQNLQIKKGKKNKLSIPSNGGFVIVI
ncbi:MAG: glycoside hydrolase family 97 C-terminal domain-containing protein, partial [Muribaculaceae bacterium]|nr:glycoside hydrolase family 97 C-terminal domain-containing protein [Muribaculaceae bacterium]